MGERTPDPGEPRTPKFTEDDFVAEVAGILRAYTPGDITLEEIVIPTRKRKDIAVRLAGRLIMIIEVKRPDRLEGGEPPEKQVEAYGKAEKCDFVAWTDGTIFFRKDLRTGEVTQTHITKSALGLYGPTRRGISTILRPGFQDDDYVQFPGKLRALSHSPVEGELHVKRSLANGFALAILSQREVVHVIAGSSDIGKTELSRDIAADAAWNAIRLEGSGIITDVGETLASYMKLLLGHTVDVAAFLDVVNSKSLEVTRVPLGIVLDGFDDWMMRNDDIGDLPHWLHRFEAMGVKVVILTRPTELPRLLKHPVLRQFCSETPTILEALTDAELNEFVSRYFRKFEIGGSLEGAAREICRNPAMLSIVAETYAGAQRVDADLTKDGLYDRYKAHKVTKLVRRRGGDEMKWVLLLDELAVIMQRTDRASLLYSELARSLGTDAVAALVDEGILVGMNSDRLADYYLRFRYGQFRDHIIWRKTTTEGGILPPIALEDER